MKNNASDQSATRIGLRVQRLVRLVRRWYLRQTMRIEDVALSEHELGTRLMVKVRGQWVEGTTGTGNPRDWIMVNYDLVFERRFPTA